MQSGKKTILFIVFGILILIVGALAYIYISTKDSGTAQNVADNAPTGFQPLDRPSNNTQGNNSGQVTPNNNNPTNTNSTSSPVVNVPTLRLLSDVPVGGYGVNTTASTTITRWIDRGRGNIYETNNLSLEIKTLSNTLVPRIYQSIWNKNLTAFISSTINEEAHKSSTLFAGLRAYTGKPASTTNDLEVTPFELKGKNLPENIVTYAVSPKKDKLFMLINESGKGVGYVSTFEGATVTKIFETPATQFNAEWPEENTITLTTKGSFDQDGFLYFVNPKTGTWKKILGPIAGLSTKTSRDAKYVLASFPANEKNLLTSIYSVTTGESSDPAIRTLAEKCTWGSFYKNMVYCGVPSQNIEAAYPDDWYRGYISTSDKLWQVNASTGEVNLLSSLSDKAKRVIDVFNLSVDDRDNYLYFMNKDDLSFWSLDLVSNR